MRMSFSFPKFSFSKKKNNIYPRRCNLKKKKSVKIGEEKRKERKKTMELQVTCRRSPVSRARRRSATGFVTWKWCGCWSISVLAAPVSGWSINWTATTWSAKRWTSSSTRTRRRSSRRWDRRRAPVSRNTLRISLARLWTRSRWKFGFATRSSLLFSSENHHFFSFFFFFFFF